MCKRISSNMLRKRGFIAFGLILIVGMSFLVGADPGITGRIVTDDFEVDSLLLKISVQEGDFVEKQISISSEEGGEFSLFVRNVIGVSLSEDNFFLQPGEIRKVDVLFDSDIVDPGVYVGHIEVVGSRESALMPIIFEVESLDVFFDVNLDIPPKYSDVAPGGKVIAQSKVFDLVGVGSSTIDMEYYLKSIEGDILISKSESIAISGQTQITKTLSLPKEVKEGNYVFIAIVKYKSSVGSSSHVLRIVGEEKDYFGGLNYVVLTLGIIVLFFFGVILLFVYFVRSRDKLVLELKRQNALELRRQKTLLMAQEKISRLKKLGNRREIAKEVKEKIKVLKREQKKKVSKFKELQKKGNVSEMKRKLSKWKREGYNVSGLGYKIKGMSTKDMKKVMEEWKKKYKTEGYKK